LGLGAALLLVVVVTHGATWFVVTGQILAGIPPFVAEAAAAGWTMRAEAPERTGWPWRASVRLPRVTAALPVGDRTLALGSGAGRPDDRAERRRGIAGVAGGCADAYNGEMRSRSRSPRHLRTAAGAVG